MERRTGRFLPLVASALAALLVGPVLAQGGRPSPPASAGEKAPEPKGGEARTVPGPQQVERLYGRLREAKTAQEAKGIAALIVRRWARSGSDTADLLMTRLQKAAKDGNLNLAMEVADRLVVLEPDWAEAWNQRANLFFRLEDHVRALYDLAETLKREPRHFGALMGLAVLLKNQGNDKGALKAYREIQKVYPLMDGVKEAVERMSPDIDGRDA